MNKNTKLKEALADYARNNAKNEILKNGYYYDFRNNIFNGKMNIDFEKMFLEGDGGELETKACAPHSSSMLGYNFFHWISKRYPVVIDGIAYNKVWFEVKIPVLKGTKCANMDIVLSNENGDWLFIESKFLEYLECGKFEISDTYKNSDKYFCNGNKWSHFISNYKTDIKQQYWQGIKQEICHLIGLTNWLEGKSNLKQESSNLDEKYNKKGKVTFVNLVFEPNKDKFLDEFNKFDAYRKLYNIFYEEIKDKLIPQNLTMEFKSYSQLWEIIKGTNLPAGLEDYLWEHYMQFANIPSSK